MSTTKYSRQRECIKDYLKSTACHPTADTVYSNIRGQFPNISLGTVYRNLNLLASQGDILKLSCGDGCDHFDGNPVPHNHFICKECGQLLDLPMDSIDHINVIASAGFAGEIEGHVTYFYGKCEDCINQKMQNKVNFV